MSSEVYLTGYLLGQTVSIGGQCELVLSDVIYNCAFSDIPRDTTVTVTINIPKIIEPKESEWLYTSGGGCYLVVQHTIVASVGAGGDWRWVGGCHTFWHQSKNIDEGKVAVAHHFARNKLSGYKYENLDSED